MTDPALALHPPKAPLVYRVGAVGHRPKRLASDPEQRRVLDGRVRCALEAIQTEVHAFAATPDAALYAPGALRMVAVTSLAEGADRIVAEAALDLGFALSCPLPFPRADFLRDFEPPTTLEPNSVARFDALMQRARDGAGLTTFELDGEPGRGGLAYARCARVVVGQSDLLLAIWDGAPAEGPGGTPDSVREALAAGVAVLWIDAHAPFGWRLLRRVEEVAPLARGAACELPPPPAGDPQAEVQDLARLLREVVANELAPPRASDAKSQARLRRSIDDYQAATRPALNLAVTWKLFRDGMATFRPAWPRLRTQDYVAQIASAWPVGEGGGPAQAHHRINARLRQSYAWADKSADRYADLHRSGFVLTSFLTPLAVLIALLPAVLPMFRHGPAATPLLAAEGAVVIGILLLLRGERRGHWHSRWMERRVLAELIRQLRLVTPVGGGRPRPRPRQHLSIYGDPAQSWMSWQVRAIERDLGLPNAEATSAYAASCLDDLAGLVEGQARFHAVSTERAEAIHGRLHRWSLALFYVTVVGVALHLMTPLAHLDEHAAEGVEAALVLVAAFCPALGAAFASVNNQGEFQRLAKRSAAMAAFFDAEALAIDGLRRSPTPARLAEVEPLIRRIADVMVDEVMDWRVVVNDRALGV